MATRKSIWEEPRDMRETHPKTHDTIQKDIPRELLPPFEKVVTAKDLLKPRRKKRRI